MKEFNGFNESSIDATNNTKTLVGQFANDIPLMITNIQKLNTAVFKERYLGSIGALSISVLSLFSMSATVAKIENDF